MTLLHIHRFCPTDVQFTDALVSSAVVVFRKSPPPAGHRVRFSFAGPIENPRARRWSRSICFAIPANGRSFPRRTNFENTDELTLGDLFAIKRGLATGSNSFFILTEEETEDWHIPRQFLKPILPGPRHVTDRYHRRAPDGAPAVSPQLYLLDCSEPEEKIKANWPRFYEYLQKGRKQEIHASYLASHRAPWYSQEQRPPAPFLCTYMGRSRNGKHPFRFIWNRSQATAHNVYLMLYPKSRLQEALKNHPELAAKVFEALQRITPASSSPKAGCTAEDCTRWSRRNLRRFLPAPCLRASTGISASSARRNCLPKWLRYGCSPTILGPVHGIAARAFLLKSWLQ